MRMLLKEYILGDMVARYEKDEMEHVGLTMYAKDVPVPEHIQKDAAVDSLVQFKLEQDPYEGCYASGNTLRNSGSVKLLKYDSQSAYERADEYVIETRLKHPEHLDILHTLIWKKGMPYVTVFCEIVNQGSQNATLELCESFSLEMLSPYLNGDCHEQLMVHRLRSHWSQEGTLESQPLEYYQLDTSWNHDSVRCERFGQIGSMPVNNFFPWLMVEDKKTQVFWGVLLKESASWQLELFRKDENLAISGGQADWEFGHWKKDIKAGESFKTSEAYLTVYHGNCLDEAASRMVLAQKERAAKVPESEKDLPLVFNEYCTTWGNPSAENIEGILKHIKGKGFTYFVIDCGWYKEKDVPWDISMGDYQISEDLFPQGLKATVQKIKESGLKPGIWFEIENVGAASKAYQIEDHLLKINGHTLTTSRRRFWDMCDPWVEAYLDEHVISLLKDYGFEYLKIDYNDTIGIGCDGQESLGEGLRKNIEASRHYVEKISENIPGIVIENCASGGHRLEPGFMGLTSMASFSDAHECQEIPIIAANLHRAILPQQSQIWAVIRKTDDLKRIAYSMCNTFLGRMCLSGDVTDLSVQQWDVIDRGIAFYRSIWKIIKDGVSYRYGNTSSSMRYPEGWQAVFRKGYEGAAYVVIHTFDGELPEIIDLQLHGEEAWKIEQIYSDTSEKAVCENHRLLYRPDANRKALAIKLTVK